jgi:hypothetical protein
MGSTDELILVICGGLCALFWIVGFVMLFIGVRITRRDFRSKGYLRAPSGTRWFRFLLLRQYEAFDNPHTRFFFGAAHFCLMAMIVSLTAMLVLVGSETLLKGMAGIPDLGTPQVNTTPSNQ